MHYRYYVSAVTFQCEVVKHSNLQSLIVGLPYLRYCPSLYCTYYYLFIFLICFLFFHVFFLYYDAVLTCQGTTDEN